MDINFFQKFYTLLYKDVDVRATIEYSFLVTIFIGFIILKAKVFGRYLIRGNFVEESVIIKDLNLDQLSKKECFLSIWWPIFIPTVLTFLWISNLTFVSQFRIDSLGQAISVLPSGSQGRIQWTIFLSAFFSLLLYVYYRSLES